MHVIHHTQKSPVLKQAVMLVSEIKGRKQKVHTQHKQYHNMQPTNNDVDFMPKKMKLSLFTSSLGSTLNYNNKINSYDKKNPKSDQHLSKIAKDTIVRHLNNDSSSDEVSDDDGYELGKELTELRKVPPRQKCVNINDVTKNCKFLIKNLKKCQSTVYADTNHMPQDLHLLDYIKNMKNQLKCVYEPKRTMFYKKLVKTPNNFEIFSLEEGYSNITVDNGMVNLFDALKSFEKKQKYTIKFVKSKLGDALKRYSANRDICWDVVHLESNTNEDLLKYKLCYGAIPDIYITEIETIVCRILLSKLNYKGKKSTNNTNKMHNTKYDLLEGELELLVFNYWQMSTRDMLGYKEHLNRRKKKMVFYYMFKNLEKNIIHDDFGGNEKQKQVVMDILKLYKSYAAFENPSILTTAGLAFVKNAACKLIPFIKNEYDLWSVFFKRFNMHSVAFDHTIKRLLEDRDRIFQYLLTRVLEIDQFNISGSAKSLWYHGITQKTTPVNLDDTIISKKDIVNCFSFYFTKPTNVPRALCVKLDNYYFLYIDLFVSFIINNSLYKYQRKLTAENCNHFFLLYDRNFHEIYLKNFIPEMKTKRMVTSMQIMVNNQLNARLEGEILWTMKMSDEVTYMLFKLIHYHLNYALTPAMLREGPALTDVQWASIFISDLDKMETFYLNYAPWRDKPYMLGGAADDLDYEPETEDLDPFKNVACADLLCSDVSSDEITDFNSSDSEEERLDEIIDKILIEKKKERLMAECKDLDQGKEHEIFSRKVSKIIQDRLQKVGYFNKSTIKKTKKTAAERKNVGHGQVEKPTVKCVPTLKAERDMVAAGALDVYLLKNNETHVQVLGLKVFGLISKNAFKTRNKGCVLCPDNCKASYNMLVSENVAVACCLSCVDLVASIIKQKEYSFEQLQKIIESRVDLRFKTPLLFNKNLQILTKMPPMLSHNDMYCSTFNKFHPKCGKILSRIDVFSHHSEHVNRSNL